MSQGVDPAVRVVLRPMASPVPLGLFTVAIGSVLVSCVQIGWLADATVAVGLVTLPAFLLQFVAGMAALVARDVVAATVMSSFSGVWLADALLYVLEPDGAATVMGVFFLTFAAFLAVVLAAARDTKGAVTLVLAVAMVRFVVSGIAQLSGSGELGVASGVLGLALALAALYAAFALLLEEVRHREVLPTLRHGAGRLAVDGDLATQAAVLPHEAGVRRTL